MRILEPCDEHDPDIVPENAPRMARPDAVLEDAWLLGEALDIDVSWLEGIFEAQQGGRQLYLERHPGSPLGPDVFFASQVRHLADTYARILEAMKREFDSRGRPNASVIESLIAHDVAQLEGERWVMLGSHNSTGETMLATERLVEILQWAAARGLGVKIESREVTEPT